MLPRIGLGCLRLEDRRSIDAAYAAGVRLFDTARAYGNEGLLRGVEATVVSKVGMRREGEAFVPDGRADTVLADAEASAAALGRAPDLLLLHAPDPRTRLETSVRALGECVRRGLATAVGLSNVGVRELDRASALVHVAAVEVALGAHDHAAARGGLVAACGARGIPVLAYGPLGGVRRAGRTVRDRVLRDVARRLGATPVQVLLAYLRAVHPAVVPLLGARDPDHAVEAAGALRVELDDAALAALDGRFVHLGRLRAPRRAVATGASEVILVSGLAGAGKSSHAVELGGTRLNRDLLGGTLAGVHRRLAERLEAGDARVVLDNTYLTRAARAEPIAIAREHGARVRCVHLDTPLADAQVNVVLRMLARTGRLLGGPELAAAAKADPNLLPPTTLFRMARELEAPVLDEGFDGLESVPFVRRGSFGAGAATCVALDRALAEPTALSNPHPTLAFGWREGGVDVEALAARLSAAAGRPVEVAVCPHAGGPPRCWCRPPLPGLLVAFFLRHAVDPVRATVLGDGPAHATLARTLGCTLGPAAQKAS